MGKKRILVLAPYPVGCAPSQRLKYEQYYTSWEKNGYAADTHSFVTEKFWRIIYKRGHLPEKFFYTLLGYIRRFFHLFRIPSYDIIYIHLWATPLGLPLYERLVRCLAKKIVYDIDDLIFLGHVSDANQWSLFFKGRRKAIYLMKRSDHVITCTPVLDEFVRKYNKSTTDISSTIDTEIYKAKDSYTIPGKPVLGWSGSHSTSKFVFLLQEILLEIKNEIDFSLLVIGDTEFTMTGIDVIALPWKRETEAEDLAKMDIGLYPLPDERWVLGKSGLKALQYMGLGIPTVATARGANFRIIKDGESGFLVKSDGEWKARILELLRNEELRKRLGRAGRAEVEQHFSIKANEGKYLDAFRKIQQ